MNIEELLTRVEARIATMADRPPTVWNNVDLPRDLPYMMVEVVPLEVEGVGLAYQHIHSGLVQISAFTRQGIGEGEANRTCARAAACFPPGTVLDGMRFDRAPFYPGGYPDNGKWRSIVQLRWRVLPGWSRQ